jgi:membrane-associated phospholipid phosphatase
MGMQSSLRLVAAVALGFVAPLALFAYLAASVVRTGRIGWDNEAARLAHDAVLAAPVPHDAARLVDSPRMSAIVVLIAFAVVLLVSGHRAYAVFWISAAGGVFVLDPLLKELFRRPGAGGEYSFPSGSAIFSAVAVTAIVAALPRGRLRVAAALLGGVLCIAFGAAIVDVYWHYPSDVVAGWAFGLAWTTGLWVAFFGRSPTPARGPPRETGVKGISALLVCRPPRASPEAEGVADVGTGHTARSE